MLPHFFLPMNCVSTKSPNGLYILTHHNDHIAMQCIHTHSGDHACYGVDIEVIISDPAISAMEGIFCNSASACESMRIAVVKTGSASVTEGFNIMALDCSMKSSCLNMQIDIGQHVSVSRCECVAGACEGLVGGEACPIPPVVWDMHHDLLRGLSDPDGMGVWCSVLWCGVLWILLILWFVFALNSMHCIELNIVFFSCVSFLITSWFSDGIRVCVLCAPFACDATRLSCDVIFCVTGCLYTPSFILLTDFEIDSVSFKSRLKLTIHDPRKVAGTWKSPRLSLWN